MVIISGGERRRAPRTSVRVRVAPPADQPERRGEGTPSAGRSRPHPPWRRPRHRCNHSQRRVGGRGPRPRARGRSQHPDHGRARRSRVARAEGREEDTAAVAFSWMVAGRLSRSRKEQPLQTREWPHRRPPRRLSRCDAGTGSGPRSAGRSDRDSMFPEWNPDRSSSGRSRRTSRAIRSVEPSSPPSGLASPASAHVAAQPTLRRARSSLGKQRVWAGRSRSAGSSRSAWRW